MRMQGTDNTAPTASVSSKSSSHFAFVDLFAGCGGLSLGLMEAGWKGLFAIEQSPDAFKTLKCNLIDRNEHNQGKPRFDWPDWLSKSPHEIRDFINSNRRQLRRLRGTVRLVAGGPPCQGFSFAGKRTGKDPRNGLFKLHLEIVDIVKPDVVLLENVQGIDTAFGVKSLKEQKRRGRPRKSYAKRIRDALSEHGYVVQQELIRASDFGVPQLRPRYFTVGIRNGLFPRDAVPNFFEMLLRSKREFLKDRRLPVRRPVTVAEAISDLRIDGKKIIDCADPDSPPGFKEIVYMGPVSRYQKLMRQGMNGMAPNSLRLVNHRPETTRRFQIILRTCRKGIQLSEKDRERLGIKKNAITPLSSDRPSHTLTTLPDDLLHYAEPRIHSVREHARFQSFPDWFEFRGKFTTGGDRRVHECPRYTQVGNAVPPLLAEAIGNVLMRLLRSARCSSCSYGKPRKGRAK
jgi:DNA (cytosine-5)-methyltransferase 1